MVTRLNTLPDGLDLVIMRLELNILTNQSDATQKYSQGS